jgi:CheY-like chemotaxis protein
MAGAWQVLVVDDEEDVHNITRIALRRRSWKGRPISLVSARSGEAARKLLETPDAPRFHCALVDVVMETNDAGLRLCDFIRANLPRTTRIVLRTGQPGAAPPEKVMNDYDIDYYLAKTEVTEERLFAVLRACFRSSLDVATLLALGTQLRAFTIALQSAATTQEVLADIMRESLRFLEEKYSGRMAFLVERLSTRDPAAELFGPSLTATIGTARRENLTRMELCPGPSAGLPDGTFVVLATALAPVDRSGASMGEKVKRWFQKLVQESEEESGAAIAVRFEQDPPERARREFMADLELFLANWRVAESSLRLQDRLIRDRMDYMKAHGQV